VHERVAGRKTEVDAKSLMLAVNTQLVWPIVLFNFGPVEKPPIWTIKYEPAADVSQISENLYRGWTMRVPITKKFYYTSMQWPEPAEGEDLIDAPSRDEEGGALPGGESDAAFAESELLKKVPTTVQRDVAEAANLEDRALQLAAPSYDRLIKKLIVEAGKMPALPAPNIDDEIEQLAAVLSNALLASCLLGRFQIQSVVSSQLSVAEFAEEDDQPKKRKRRTTDEGPLTRSFDLPPDEAIEYFEAKKVVRKKEFNQLSKDAQQGAFTVSGVYRDDVLRGFKDEIDQALRSGATQEQTIKRFKGALSAGKHRELGEFHLETVFRTNMQTAYGVGRRRGLEEVGDAFPFWQYHAVMDDRTRPRHAAINGVILPSDNPFWEEHYPPWGFELPMRSHADR